MCQLPRARKETPTPTKWYSSSKVTNKLNIPCEYIPCIPYNPYIVVCSIQFNHEYLDVRLVEWE